MTTPHNAARSVVSLLILAGVVALGAVADVRALGVEGESTDDVDFGLPKGSTTELNTALKEEVKAVLAKFQTIHPDLDTDADPITWLNPDPENPTDPSGYPECLFFGGASCGEGDPQKQFKVDLVMFENKKRHCWATDAAGNCEFGWEEDRDKLAAVGISVYFISGVIVFLQDEHRC